MFLYYTRTFIAYTLQLQPTRFAVSTFGAQVSTLKKFSVALIYIHAIKGGQISVSVLVVPKLAALVRNLSVAHLSLLLYSKGLSPHPLEVVLTKTDLWPNIY